MPARNQDGARCAISYHFHWKPDSKIVSSDVACHHQMVALVERMLDLHKELAAEQMPHVKTVLQRHAKGGGDGSADQLVGLWAARHEAGHCVAPSLGGMRSRGRRIAKTSGR